MNEATELSSSTSSSSTHAATDYRCHECGEGLYPMDTSTLLWCGRCLKRRRTPTHPALIRTELAEAAA